MDIVIGDNVFNSQKEVLQYYRNILYHSTVPMSYHDTRNVLQLIATADSAYYANVCGRGGRKIDYVYVAQGNTPTITLRLLDGKEVKISIYKFTNKCYKIFLKIHAEKTDNKKLLRKFREEEIEERIKKGLSCRKYFLEACRRAIQSHVPKKEKTYTSAHHANPGGFSQIVTDFIQEFHIDINQPIYTVIATDYIRFTDSALGRKFAEFHDARVEWQIVTWKQHKKLHKDDGL